MQKPAQLKITDPFNSERLVELSRPLFSVGRDGSNDLQLFSDKVSRQHLLIAYEKEAYWLIDQGSTNGSFVNNQRVERCLLGHLDCLSAGGEEQYRIQFLQPPEMQQPPELPAQTADTHDAPETSSAKEELNKLLRFVEVNRAFKFSMSPEDVLSLVVDAAIEMSGADRGFLMLKNLAGELTFRVARDSQRRNLSGSDFAMSHSAAQEAFHQDRNIILRDSLDGAFQGSESMLALELRTVVCIPLHHFRLSDQMNRTLIHGPEVIGVLYVDSHAMRRALTPTSIALLESLAFEASKCLESIRQLQEELEKQTIERELEMARRVQEALLPKVTPPGGLFDIAARSIPCRYVGGDFYDLITLAGGSTAVVLGDVCGKGIAAALLASMAQGILQAQLTSSLSLAEAVATLNRLLLQKADDSRFITLFCAQLDRSGCLDWINAGHNPPMLLRGDGSLEQLAAGSMLLGAFENAQFQVERTQLLAGDLLVVFSDGITEAANATKELYGEERLARLLQENPGLNPEPLLNLVAEHIAGFTQGQAQHDDMTLLILKMNPGDQQST